MHPLILEKGQQIALISPVLCSIVTYHPDSCALLPESINFTCPWKTRLIIKVCHTIHGTGAINLYYCITKSNFPYKGMISPKIIPLYQIYPSFE